MIRRSEAVADHGSSSNHLWVPEQGAFSVVVPNLLQGAELVMFASPNERPDPSAGIGGPADRAARAPAARTRSGGYARAGLIMAF